jgi:flagellar basal-body rod protein FlgB
VNFESELKRALDNNKYTNENRVPALITDNRHIPFFVERDIKSVQPRINLDYSTSMRNDGNNVDIEKEMVDAAKNKMRYDALVAALNII